MAKDHLKRLATPKTWQIKRKGITFITRPHPGGHTLAHSMALGVVMRELLGLASTAREVRTILYSQEVLVDGVRRKDSRYPVGLMDVIAIPAVNEYYRMLLSGKGFLVVHKIDKKEAQLKPCKILGKTARKKGIFQLNLSSGINILVAKDTYKTGETLMLETPAKKVSQEFKMEKGAYILMIGGKHAGDHGVVEDIKDKNKMISYMSHTGSSAETLVTYAFVIGKEKPHIAMLK